VLDDAVDFTIEVYDINGVVCSTVKDGHIIMIRKSMLPKLIEAAKNKKDVVLYNKRPVKNC
jgi:hypothetical protein